MLREGKNKTIYLILLFPTALGLVYIADRFPNMVERYYSRLIYKGLSQVISGVTGVFSFSVAEVLVVLASGAVMIGIVKGIAELIKNPGNRLTLLLRRLLTVVIIISVAYFCFIIIWGLNYHRLPISEIINLRVEETSTEELKGLCAYLIEEANGLRGFMTEDQRGIMTSIVGVQDMLKRAHRGYDAVAGIIPELAGRYGRPKGVMLSVVLSYQGIGGIYFPFTGEANVNISEPHFIIPFTASHEMAHQRGFAREDEANYIGHLACVMHPDKDFQYSGIMAALQYSMNALARQDVGSYRVLREGYSDGVRRDFDAWSEHCKKYDGALRRTTDRINDAYLQSNIQRDGVQSYGRMVDLLLAHYRDKTKVYGAIQ